MTQDEAQRAQQLDNTLYVFGGVVGDIRQKTVRARQMASEAERIAGVRTSACSELLNLLSALEDMAEQVGRCADKWARAARG